jgi:hypothetical protein
MACLFMMLCRIYWLMREGWESGGLDAGEGNV